MTALTTFLLLCATTAWADSAGHPRLTLFGSDIGYSRSDNNAGGWSGGGGIALGYEWSPRWSADIAVASERHTVTVTRFVPAAGPPPAGEPQFVPATFFESYRTHPIDATLRYTFAEGSRWRPFAGVGVHHVSAPDTRPSGVVVPVIPGPGGVDQVRETTFSNVNKAEVVGGIAVKLTPRLSIEAGARRLLTGSRPENAFDPVTRGIIGLSFRY